MRVSKSAVRTVLVKKENGEHRPIYYTSKVLQRAEVRYFAIEKFTYAVVVVARTIKPFFQAH